MAGNEISAIGTQNVSAFANADAFEAAQRMAKAIVSSSLVPKEYQGQQNIPNAMIALEAAQRIGASPLMVMQNLYIVHGKPAWSSQFIIAAINGCGRFEPLEFNMVGDEGDNSFGCYVTAKNKKTGDTLKGPTVTMAMAHAEGWYNKTGSKWKTMPEVMLRYRAASFFGKNYAPEILMGMQTAEEMHDIEDRKRTGERSNIADAFKDEPKDITPKYAEIASGINNAKSADEANEWLDLARALPMDQQAEINHIWSLKIQEFDA